MNKSYKYFIIIFLVTISFTNISSAVVPTFNMTIKNINNMINPVTGGDSLIFFDVYLRWTNPATSGLLFEYATCQGAITINHSIFNGGVIYGVNNGSFTKLPGASDLPLTLRPPSTNCSNFAGSDLLQWSATSSNPYMNFIISSSFPGTKIQGFRVRTTAPNWACVSSNIRFKLGTAPTSLVAYYEPSSDPKDPDNQLPVLLLDTVTNIYSIDSGLPVPCGPHPLSPKLLNLTLLIQGLYNNFSNTTLRDTVSVSLRENISPFSLLLTEKGLIDSTGKVKLYFYTPETRECYLQIRNRNLVETWSTNPHTLDLSYDFTTSDTQAYGQNLKLVNTSPIRYACYNGDVNQDGFVNLTDISMIYSDITSFLNGYRATDLTGDNQTDLTDLILGYNNSTQFVKKYTP